MHLTSQELLHEAHQAGYEVLAVEQMRANRWVLTLRDEARRTILVLVQARALISSADVADLAVLTQLRRPDRGLLLAYGGTFSPSATRTLNELSNGRLQLCRAFPPTPKHDAESQPISAVLRSVLQ